MFIDNMSKKGDFYTVFKSATLASDALSGFVTLALAVSNTGESLYLKIFNSCSALKRHPVIAALEEGRFFQCRTNAIEQFEQAITQLEYSEFDMRTIDADNGDSFISGGPHELIRPTFLHASKAANVNFAQTMICQMIHGGVRTVVVKDIALGIQAFQLGDSLPRSVNLNPAVRIYLEELLERLGAVSALLEVWVNRSAAYVTDIAFRTISEDYTGGALVFRLKAASQKLPAGFFQGVFNSRVVLPEKYSPRLLQMLNPHNAASPVMYVRDGSSGLISGNAKPGYLIDSRDVVDAVIMSNNQNNLDCLDVEADTIVSFASPSSDLSGSVLISGIRQNHKIRPVLF